MIDAAARSALEQVLGERIQFDVPMSRHTSLRVGGAADALASPRDVEELSACLAVCAERSLPHFTMGAGFNVLVRDGGIDGVVISIKKLRGIERRGQDAIYVEAGASHATVTRYCIEAGLSGLEFAAGIPGTVGGWVAMNAGIGVREIKDVAIAIRIVPSRGGAPRCIERAHLDFRYRALRGLEPGSVVIGALLRVSPTSRAEVKAEVDRLMARRSQTQPLDVPSCGSVFRNPEGDHAGRLIEAAGLKGERIGGAQITQVHANFIANTGGATAADILALIELARRRVLETSGVALETEVQIMGRPE